MKVSVSQANLFKACRRAWYFKYVEGLVSRETSDALETGLKYHERVDALYKGTPIEDDLSKDCAMAKAYEKYVFPNMAKPFATEMSFETKLNERHTLVGRVDGMTKDGYIIEHKTSGGDIGEQYEYNLQWNEQILAYMYASGVRRMIYTICRKPTIRQKKGESDEEFFNRMVEWYDTDTESKIRYFVVERTDDEVEAYRQELIRVCDEMEKTQNLYRNSGWCTVWGTRCEYSSICLDYDPRQEYVEFERR